MKVCSGNLTLTAPGNILVPIDTRVNPLNLAGSITDANASTYALKYSTADVYAPGYTVAGDNTLTAFPGTPPTTSSKGFILTGVPATAMVLSVTATSGSGVTLNAVFQSDNLLGA